MLLKNTGAHASRYRPSVRVDVVLLQVLEGVVYLIVEQRLGPPYRGYQVLPGATLKSDETPRATAERILRRYTHQEHPELEQLDCHGEPNRDPRGHVLTIPYLCLLPPQELPVNPPYSQRVKLNITEISGQCSLSIQTSSGLPLYFGFDHSDIVRQAVLRMRSTLSETNAAYSLLAEQFTLRELRLVHETLLGQALNKDNFRRKVLAAKQIAATGKKQAAVGHRPAMLYERTSNTK